MENKLIIPGFAKINGDSFSLVVEMNEKSVAALKAVPSLAKEVQEVASVIFEKLAEEFSREELQKGKVLLEGEKVYFSSEEDNTEVSNYPLKERAFQLSSLSDSGVGLNLLDNKHISGAFQMIMSLTEDNQFVSLSSSGASREFTPIILFSKESSDRSSIEKPKKTSENHSEHRRQRRRPEPSPDRRRNIQPDRRSIQIEEVMEEQPPKAIEELFQPKFQKKEDITWYERLLEDEKSRFSRYVQCFDGTYPEVITSAQVEGFKQLFS